MKFDGHQLRRLTEREARQIAGRAGRYKGKFPVGYVTTLWPEHFPTLQRLLSTPLKPLTHAALNPTLHQLQALSERKPAESLSSLLQYLQLFAVIDDIYSMSNAEDMIAVARVLDRFPGLTFTQRFSICVAPCSVNKAKRREALIKYVRAFVAGQHVDWRQLNAWASVEKMGRQLTAEDIEVLEDVWQALDLSAATAHTQLTALLSLRLAPLSLIPLLCVCVCVL